MNEHTEAVTLLRGIEKRLRRVETRFTSYAHNTGVDVHRNAETPIVAQVFHHAGTLHLTHPQIMVGDLLRAARKHQCPDGAPVYLNGRLILKLRIDE